MTIFQLCTYIFFFNDTATTEIYTLSLHDALPISMAGSVASKIRGVGAFISCMVIRMASAPGLRTLGARLDMTMMPRSEEHTSELQSRQYLVCRLLLEKKNKIPSQPHPRHYAIY